MWCLMLCEPVCGIQIYGKEAMGFLDLLVGVYGYGRVLWICVGFDVLGFEL